MDSKMTCSHCSTVFPNEEAKRSHGSCAICLYNGGGDCRIPALHASITDGKCEYCQDSMNLCEQIAEHFQCKLCSKTFTSCIDLIGHKYKDHHYCRYCRQCFLTSDEFATHQATCVSESSEKWPRKQKTNCQLCSQECSKSTANHFSEFHPNTCYICLTEFPTSEAAKKHLFEKNCCQPMELHCQDCKVTFQSVVRYFDHKKCKVCKSSNGNKCTSLTDDSICLKCWQKQTAQALWCSYCSKSFASQNDYNAHATCDFCNKVLPKCTSLSNHKTFEHNSERGIQCSLCTSRFESVVKLLEHHNKNHFVLMENVQVLSCGKCQFRTGLTKAFSDHTANFCGQRLNQCTFCDLILHQSEDFSLHMSSCHSDKVTPHIQRFGEMESVFVSEEHHNDSSEEIGDPIGGDPIESSYSDKHNSQVQTKVFQCTTCDFQSDFWTQLRRHQIKCKERRTVADRQVPDRNQESLVSSDVNGSPRPMNFEGGPIEPSSSEQCEVASTSKLLQSRSLNKDHCSLCKFELNKNATSFNDLHNHNRRYHFRAKKLNVFNCGLCPFETGLSSVLICHNKSCNGSKLVRKCHFCDVWVSRGKALRRHAQRFHSDQKNKDEILPYKNRYSATGREQRLSQNSQKKLIDEPCKSTTSLSEPEIELRCNESLDESESSFTIADPKEEQKRKVLNCSLCRFEVNYYINNAFINLKSHDLRSHFRAKGLRVYKCEACPYETGLQSQLNAHAQHCSKLPNPVKCRFCDAWQSHQQTLRHHQLKNHWDKMENIKIFSCAKCDFQTGYGSFMYLHEKRCCAIGNWKCDFCEKPFRSKSRMKEHVKSCSIFLELNSSTDPIKIEPTMESSFQFVNADDKDDTATTSNSSCCSLCKFQLPNHGSNDIQGMMNHYRACHFHARKLKVLKCSSCSYETGLQKAFHFHMSQKSCRWSLSNCEHCDLVCSKKALREHLKKNHWDKLGDVVIYTCTKCGFQTGLLRHFANHEEQCGKPKATVPIKHKVKCSYCDRTFIHDYNKMLHEKTAHHQQTAQKRQGVELVTADSKKTKLDAANEIVNEVEDTANQVDPIGITSNDICQEEDFTYPCDDFDSSIMEEDDDPDWSPLDVEHEMENEGEDWCPSDVNDEMEEDEWSPSDNGNKIDRKLSSLPRARKTQCPHCKFQLLKGLSSKSMYAHYKRCHFRVRKLRVYNCPSCPYETGSQLAFDRHTNAPNVCSGQALSCDYCDIRFSRTDKLNEHKKTNHWDKLENIEMYSCDKCDFQTGSLTFFRRHERQCSKPRTLSNGSVFECSYCEATFKMKKSMYRHERRYHFDKMSYVKKFNCKWCHYKTGDNSTFTQHLKSCRMGDRTDWLHCDKCDKAFPVKWRLERHIKMECKYSGVKSLKIQDVHSIKSEDPLTCKYCQKSFGNKKMKRRHVQKTHYLGGKVRQKELINQDFEMKPIIDSRPPIVPGLIKKEEKKIDKLADDSYEVFETADTNDKVTEAPLDENHCKMCDIRFCSVYSMNRHLHRKHRHEKPVLPKKPIVPSLKLKTEKPENGPIIPSLGLKKEQVENVPIIPSLISRKELPENIPRMKLEKEELSEEAITCHICLQTFSRLTNKHRHMVNIHGVQPAKVISILKRNSEEENMPLSQIIQSCLNRKVKIILPRLDLFPDNLRENAA